MKRIRSIILVICCINVGHFGVILYMVVWNLQFSVSNIVRATYLKQFRDVKYILSWRIQYIFYNHESHNSLTIRFLCSSSSS